MRFYPTKMTPVTTIGVYVSEVYVFTHICGTRVPNCAPGCDLGLCDLCYVFATWFTGLTFVFNS